VREHRVLCLLRSEAGIEDPDYADGEDGAHELGDDERWDRGGRDPGKGGVDQRDDRVEVRSGDRAEHEDEGEEPGRRRRRVLEQLQAGVAGRERGGGDPRADHRRGEEGGAEELGKQAPR
jgi:hypothetical protein